MNYTVSKYKTIEQAVVNLSHLKEDAFIITASIEYDEYIIWTKEKGNILSTHFILDDKLTQPILYLILPQNRQYGVCTNPTNYFYGIKSLQNYYFKYKD